ncbi:MAG: hypothetical protein J6B20_02100 [Clostridia bacterium]|nr:hypothetical protein [Clostridia bacterium]
MKKLCKLLTIILVGAMFLLTPGATMVAGSLSKLAPTATQEYNYTAPNQSSALFSFESETHDLSTWTKPSNNYLLAQQVDNTTNNKFHETYPDNTLSDAKLADHTPYVIINSTPNMATKGCYTTSSITLSANSYYLISVEYYVVEQANKDADNTNYAFGTFALNDMEITLLPQDKWDVATFYITTDKLATATVTPALHFGSNDKNALGGIYFDKFTVSAVSANKFNSELADRNASTSYRHDFTQKDETALHAEFNNEDFTPSHATASADSYNNIVTSSIPDKLNFADRKYFYHKDGDVGEVMLIKANNSNASLVLEDYTFQPKPHETYMFQFYSIATAAADFGGFYFMIGETAQQITNLTDYPHHNGWQLNTIFFVAGQNLNQEYTLKFTLNSSDSTTGWACIDEFKIYKVNGSYASDNATAIGVHDTYDQNADTETLDIANGNFNQGKTADSVNAANSSYPYPLVANDWTTNNNANGIVNLHASLWDERFGSHPNYPANSTDNNHVYMMHNSKNQINILTSPIVTTTTGSTTYISFDAYSTTAAATRAYILTAETDEEGNLTNEIVLKDILNINDNQWHHYQFEVIENKFASSRNYYLRFEMQGTGYAYIDNVRTLQSPADQQTTSATIDLNNTLAITEVWQTTDTTVDFYVNATPNGLTLENINQQKTTIQNSFGYNLTADEYYEIVIKARGNNAHLGLNNYDGLLAVTTDAVEPEATFEYKVYLQPKEGTTTINLQIILGDVSEDDTTAQRVDGDIFIDSIAIDTITEDEFNNIKEIESNDARLKILTASTEDTEEEEESTTDITDDGNFFGENWWFLIPSLITAIALLLGITAFLLRKIKFDKHITKKTTSYARDMRLKNQQKKIVAQKAAKVDNVTDEQKNN